MDRQFAGIAAILAVVFLFGGSCEGCDKQGKISCGEPVAVQLLSKTSTTP